MPLGSAFGGDLADLCEQPRPRLSSRGPWDEEASYVEFMGYTQPWYSVRGVEAPVGGGMGTSSVSCATATAYSSPTPRRAVATRWAKASDMRALLTDEVVEQISAGRDDVRAILTHVRIDLDRYLAKVAGSS